MSSLQIPPEDGETDKLIAQFAKAFEASADWDSLLTSSNPQLREAAKRRLERV
jgi:hypothetical protein